MTSSVDECEVFVGTGLVQVPGAVLVSSDERWHAWHCAAWVRSPPSSGIPNAARARTQCQRQCRALLLFALHSV